MFCPECGTKNDDTALFCENCGTKLQQKEQSQEQMSNQQTNVKTMVGVSRQPMSRKTKSILVVLVIAIIASIVFSVVGKKVTSPEKIALNYFKDVANANWEKVYTYYDLSESEFVNKESFTKAVEKKDKIEYLNYAIKNDTDLSSLLDKSASNSTNNEKQQGITRNITIEYAAKNSSETSLHYNVKLVKTAKKKLLFFDDWKVVPEDMIAKNYFIKTIKDIDVKLDGIKLSDKYLSDDENDSSYDSKLDIYKIPSIFSGNHKIEFSGDFINDYKDDLKINAFSDHSYSYTNPEIKDDFVKELEKKTEEVIKKAYESAIDNKDFDDMDLPCDIYNDNKDDVEEVYDNLVKNMDKTSYSSDIEVKSLDIKEFEVTDDNSYIDNGCISATISYKAKYDGEFVKNKDGNDEMKKDEGNLSGTVSYNYVDGKWKISRMYFSHIYYYWF